MPRRKTPSQLPLSLLDSADSKARGEEEQDRSAAASSPPVDLVRVGKDEMNLVEYPFATLRHEASADAFIERQWEAEHPITRRTLKASWRVTGDPILGLPTPTEERLFLVLMELAREAGFDQEIYFTRYGLIQRLGWPDNAKSYHRLTEGFRRLTAVTITSENAFWNPAAKSFHNRGFHILESYDIVAEPPGRKKKVGADLPLSHFRWSREMRDSFAAGYIRSIDLSIALTLILPLSARLFRYLDKKKYDGKSFFDIEVRRLCEIHLGMTPTKHASTLKVRLQPAHEELVTRGIVQGVQYLPMKTKSAEKVRYLFIPAEITTQETKITPESPFQTELGENIAEISVSPSSEVATAPEPAPPIARMTALGVSSAIAFRLAQDAPPETLSLQLDCLADRNPKDAAATFVAAVRGAWAPPAAFLARREAEGSRRASENVKRQKAAEKRELERLQAEHEATETLQNDALDARFLTLPGAIQQEIESGIRERMQFVLQHLGAEAASNGWAATRRQIMREWEEGGRLEPDHLESIEPRSERALSDFSSDKEVEAMFDRLSDAGRENVETEAQKRLETSGLGHLKFDHPGRAGVRRTVMREMLKSGQIKGEVAAAD